ncbi:hypothetical protein C8R43DRAFT_568147 [Mycena crocata]|nr:hypothetical protein C8R43DRAFT_568147 [Mycena crocata]
MTPARRPGISGTARGLGLLRSFKTRKARLERENPPLSPNMPGPQKSLPSFWTRKRTGRSSPDPQDDPQPDSKKARHLMPSQSYPNDVKAMPKNEGSSTRPNNKIDLNDRLVFQFVDIHAFIPGVVLVFGVTEASHPCLEYSQAASQSDD